MAILTDTKARNTKPDDPQQPHGGVTGLVLIPSKSKGRGKWVLRYVSPVTGKRRNAGLGAYPEVSIAEAGKAGLALRELITLGKDPLEEKIEENDSGHPADFKTAAEAVHRELLPSWKNKKHGQQWITTLKTYAFPEIGHFQLDQIKPKHIADVLRPIWLTKAETAGRLKQRLHAVMAWGWAHGLCSANPVDVVNHLLPPQPGKSVRTEHQPAMPWREMPDFFREHFCEKTTADSTRKMLELLILTGARSGEIRGMCWEEINLPDAVWTIPAERMKAKQVHRIPLTQRAIEILNDLDVRDEGLVFRTPRKDSMFSDMVLTAFLRRIQAVSSTPGRFATAHGFRSSFRDWCSENGYPRDLAERALAHAIDNKVEAAYHRTDLLEQRRPMMQAWENHCMSKCPVPDDC